MFGFLLSVFLQAGWSSGSALDLRVAGAQFESQPGLWLS